ncbi:MAG: hypothetical protein EPN21_12290 [Methylococcaceae bacterium]|nr:MAG: hypothetical protein EPN21_12290 [Methylococcaceae bacterium]
MSTTSIDDLIQKVLSDASLRDRLLADPKGVLEEAGCEATPDLVDTISKIDPEDLVALVRGFEAGRASDKIAA